MSATSPYDDEKLLVKLREGDYRAFEQIYNRYSTPLGYRLLRLLKSETLAEELLQDLFLKVWEVRETIDISRPFKSYLYRIAQNMAIDLFRRAAREKELLSEIITGNSELYSHILEDIYQQENQELLNSAIALLPPQRRKVFILCKLEGRSSGEVAGLLNISKNTVNDHLQKAGIFLKSHLSSSSEAGFITIFLYSLLK